MRGQQLCFDTFVLSADGTTLRRDGVLVPVSYRGILLLSALLKRSGEVLSKSDLMESVWQGTTVEESNLTVQIASLRKLLGTRPDGGEWITTVPRIGYRFDGATELREATDSKSSESSSEPLPSIAVLPFTNLGDDAEQQYFADGLAEDIISRLGRLRWLFVSAHNSSFVYRGKTVDARQVGEELGVRYILDGSVRRSGARLRISARLSDAKARQQVWANQYDVEQDDFLTLQDVIAESVVAAIEPRLHAAEHQRVERGRSESLDAWGLVMKAMPHMWPWGTSGDIDIAQSLLKRALEIEPNYPRANSLMAWTHGARAQLGWSDARGGLDVGLAMAQRAIQRDPEDPWAHAAAGYVHMVSRDFDLAVGALKEAINLNPSFALAHMILASTYGYGGEGEEGLRHVAVANRLSPRDFAQAANFATAGLCQFMAGRYAEGMDLEQKAVELRPYFVAAWRTLAACAGMAGETATATHAVSQAKRLQPSLSVEWVEKYHAIVRAVDRERYIHGMKVGGLR
jgi:TolB-like protein/tetratricopeptide (TPR) repeat protein